MTEKNQKKEKAKRMRNTWAINPTTRIKESKKKYSRKGRKYKSHEEYV